MPSHDPAMVSEQYAREDNLLELPFIVHGRTTVFVATT
jgi:hypothetical protein